MTTVAIELNDAGLMALAEGGQQLAASPGFALMDGHDLVVGLEAQARARLEPRWIDNRYWLRLDTNSMPRPFPRNLTRADVAHAHLTRLWERIRLDLGVGSGAAALLAIPGSFTVGQLGLILGVARAAEIPVTGMVDAAVAAAATSSVASRTLHLEALLHRMIWTELEHNGELVRRRVEVLETGGLAAVRDAWAKHIAQLLIRRTRFDPFHHGKAEQTLYDRLPEWLQELSTVGTALVSLESEGKVYAVELTGEDVVTVSAGLTAPIVEVARGLSAAAGQATVLLSARAASIPGLLQPLTRALATEAVTLEEAAAAKGALEFRPQIEAPGEELPFIVRLPAEPPPVAEPLRPSPPASADAFVAGGCAPTHVLFEGSAHALTAEPLCIGSAPTPEERGLEVGGPMPGLSRRHCTLVRTGGSVVLEDRSRFGTFLNDRQVDGRAEVQVGDRIRLGSPGIELLLISVLEDNV